MTTFCALTTTQSLACAPTNLINADPRNGQGIDTFRNGADTGSGLFPLPDGDAAACCQRCQDADGCAAVAMGLLEGNRFCELLFSERQGGNGTCGLGLEYANTGTFFAPGNGFVVQAGCGTVEPLQDR